jgi:hypothetical protein
VGEIMEQVTEKKLKVFLNDLVTFSRSLLPEDKLEFEWEQAPADLHNKFYITIKVAENAFEDNE